MAAVANYAAWLALNKAPWQWVPIGESTITGVTGRFFSLWLAAGGSTGVAPTTAAVPTAATAGAIGQQFWNAAGIANAADEQFISRLSLSSQNRNGYVICDRLSHQGGLSGVTTTEQTTNLPTAALTRYTTGAGVMIGLEIYSQVGTTPTTVTVRYTNQAGTGSRTTNAAVFGGTGWREASRMILCPLQNGDTGVQSVEGVTVLATTGTAGNFGVTLFKPLLPLTCVVQDAGFTQDGLLNGAGIIPALVDDACLWFCAMCGGNQAGFLYGEMNLIEP